MSKKTSPPKYLIIYRCEYCGQDCGYTERDKPRCRFCERTDRLIVVSKQKITPEVMAARLKVVTDNMMKNLTEAYEQLPNIHTNIVSEGKDAESILLRLMDKAKKLRDKVQALEFKKNADNS